MTDTYLLNNSRILLVDDEPANLKLLRKMLSGQGYNNLVEIKDPREVISAYQQQRPDLILLDINMPHLDGYAVMDQLKALQDVLMPPILILTAQHQREYMLRALDGGARDFLSKPFDRNELLMRVRNLLEVHLAHRMMHEQNALLEQKVAERTRELDSTRLQVIRRLGRAAEFRDNETGLHVVRMSKYAAILARSLGWSNSECELLLNASPMHDLGKIGIPDYILLKPGKLAPDEYQIMQDHARIGATLLDGDESELLSLAREIAETHHEKWDGSGYPKGLVGEAIPLSGRITALADVFDALTSSRPYKKAWAIEDALNFIKEQSGRHFDPELVKHFERCLPEILAVREAHLEEKGADPNGT
ncbi:MAG: response regulator [Marinospirillum sp.]|uniref:HD domain-containing phosphohydrolase n=1 Tax=Marinospirillum sp. TaxID=2183934 RepID=UPI0019DCB423|nr:HD domain-containing phosphohydrolase [Marinospirillum sp.]MBE0507509.1 response regulator [Marinospirillum sp.]